MKYLITIIALGGLLVGGIMYAQTATLSQSQINIRNFATENLDLTILEKRNTENNFEIEVQHKYLEDNGIGGYEEVQKTFTVKYPKLYSDACFKKINNQLQGFPFKTEAEALFKNMRTEADCINFINQAIQERIDLEESNLREDLEKLKTSSFDVSDINL